MPWASSAANCGQRRCSRTAFTLSPPLLPLPLLLPLDSSVSFIQPSSPFSTPPRECMKPYGSA
eukprot:7627256-Karenia_brevis.AAC.1